MTAALLRPAAAADIEDAYQWYEGKQTGLGEKFLSSVSTAIKSISVHPEKHPVVYRGTRRVLLRLFPYGLFYKVTDQGVVVVACFHVSRDPRKWKSRA